MQAVCLHSPAICRKRGSYLSSASSPLAVPSAASRTKSLRIGVLSAIGTMDPRDSGDTITGLILGQVFETAYAMTASGSLEPALFSESLRKDRDGAQPVYSAPVTPGIVFSDGTELTGTRCREIGRAHV